MGDKRGRLSVLFGSILLYSLANIANGFAETVTQYAVLRFIAGIGLAGELGAGITLVSETLPTKLRGYGTTLVASVGLMGAVLANYIAKTFDWQIAYFIGGGLGLLLLIARVSVFESGIFLKVKEQHVERGNFFQLFNQKDRFVKFLGMHSYRVAHLVCYRHSHHLLARVCQGHEHNGHCGWRCRNVQLHWPCGWRYEQWFVEPDYSLAQKDRVFLFILLTLAFVLIYLYAPVSSSTQFYVVCFLLGFGIGYWALFVTIAAEQFGTNLRSTVATTVPNFIRGYGHSAHFIISAIS
jgi:putative MFS transporter